ncbi:MAG: hypothetical protein ABIN67_04990 [Ferruginibacter sp.]
MNKTTNQNVNQTQKLNNNKKRAENKDNLDSREGEEQLTKGNDTTHNKKEKQSERANIKK